MVAAHQQARLQQAMIEIVATDGYEAVTVRSLAKRARISTGTFYKHYSSTDDCLLCTFDQICGRASRRMTEAVRNEPEPRRRLALAAERLFQDMVAAPQAATFMLRAAPTVGPAFTGDLWNSAMRLGAALELCIGSDSGSPLHPLLLEGVIAGLARIGGTLPLEAGEDEVRGAATEAVDWAMSLCAPPSSAELSTTAAPRRLLDDDLGGALGDERAMLLAATFRIARDGYHQLSVSRICRQAGISRRDFARHFESLEECFVAAVEERAGGAIEAAVQGWDPSAALRLLCDWVEEDRDSARVVFVEITAAGTNGIDCRDRLIFQVARALSTPAPAAEASASAAWTILRRFVLDVDMATTEALPALTLLMLVAGDKRRTTENKRPTIQSLDLP